jgi:hypothetical protein
MVQHNEAPKGLMNKFFSWFKKPFMFPSGVFPRIVIALTFGLFVFLFLRIFLPYGLSEIPVNKTAYISWYGIFTTLVISCWLFIAPLVSPGIYDIKNFTIGKYILLCFGNTLLVNIANWIYTRTAGSEILPHYAFLPFSLYTFSVSVFPVMFLTLVIDKAMLVVRTKQSILSQARQVRLKEEPDAPNEFRIRNAQGVVQLHFAEEDFICARSNGNYTFIYFRQNGVVHKELIRISLARFCEQVKDASAILRCHRSNVVNLRYVRQISGNSHSLELDVEHVEESIPVSREFPRTLLYSPLRGQQVSKRTLHPADQASRTA